MRFAYESYDIPKSPLDGSTEIYRPEIPIRLLGARGEFFSLALVDTGADSGQPTGTFCLTLKVRCR
ncbi:MAG: hypothetical protein ACKV2Q_13330 [Planctomycetaceae bacterium]